VTKEQALSQREDALLAGAGTQDDREQLGVGESGGTVVTEALPRPLQRGDLADADVVLRVRS
jgi:hypothetical protein